MQAPPQPIPPPRLPPRDRDAHKGTSGYVLVVGGSTGMAGAPKLAATAASRIGAGLVTVAVPAPVKGEVTGDPTLLVEGLPATATGGVAWPAIGPLRELARARGAVVLGPGLGRHPATLAVARALGALEVPLVADADALRAWDGGGLPRRADRVFTPHPGEAAHLLGTSSRAVQADRPAALRALHAILGGVVLLKGRGTLITDGRQVLVNPTGNPGLAKGGSGDVLAGMIGGLLAQGTPPLDAASTAAFLHGLAADELLALQGERSQDPLALLDHLRVLVRRFEVRRPGP